MNYHDRPPLQKLEREVKEVLPFHYSSLCLEGVSGIDHSIERLFPSPMVVSWDPGGEMLRDTNFGMEGIRNHHYFVQAYVTSLH